MDQAEKGKYAAHVDELIQREGFEDVIAELLSRIDSRATATYRGTIDDADEALDVLRDVLIGFLRRQILEGKSPIETVQYIEAEYDLVASELEEAREEASLPFDEEIERDAAADDGMDDGSEEAGS